ncbi:DNA primase [Microbacterium sp. cx-55]|uniref:DNA primase n=1 Tax=unclassified Microbacterium TaxID=2609290 RepID=UPI001CBB8014|nr:MULTISPECIES: DNA primase [unclassified Microbacterium]MBZ4486263.1 DNA primase [Microbacterium sp. cx-55]MCC4907253.1 DNA primase [Microbacterium sp. cx-59]UGB33872.1 DNA primase [Microbacterium sp. cx-55]
MPGRIAQADVEEVKSRTNIADIVGERVALKSAGVGSLKGLCPFHDERSPSFHVRPQVGFYHCFGCGESGDVYTFLRQMDHVSFTEAVERLAARIGFTLHYEEGGAAPETSGRARLYAANAAAAEFYRSQLLTPEAEVGRRFLGERGFDAGAAAHFGVGFAPPGWSALLDALTAKGFTRDELTTAGLVSQGQRGVYDRFRGRLVWPIRDVTGQVIGFGARKLLESDQGPKYLNTPETPIYRKSQVLYGLDLAKRDVSRDHRVVVVEGYTDVMACHLAGITTAVATCGTAFGTDHITVLRRVMGDDSAAGEVVFTFDPDAAGQKAALRAFGEEKRFAAQTYVAVAPAGLDPCDLRLQRGDGAVRALLETKVPMFEFVIDQRVGTFDLSTVEGRAGALRSAAPIVAEIRDPALRPGYTRVLARRLGLDLSEVGQAVDRAGRASRAGDSSTSGRSASRPGPTPDGGTPPVAEVPRVTIATLPRDPDVALERDALMGFLQYGHRIDPEDLRAALDESFRHPALEAVRSSIAAVPDHTRPGWAAAAVDAVREPYRSFAAELLTGDFPARDDRHAITSAKDLARRIRLRGIEREKRELVAAIQRLAADSEEGRTVRLRLRELDADRQRLTGEQ